MYFDSYIALFCGYKFLNVILRRSPQISPKLQGVYVIKKSERIPAESSKQTEGRETNNPAMMKKLT